MPKEVLFEELGIEERKLLLRAYDYDIDEQGHILSKTGEKIPSKELPSEFLKVEDVALVPGSLEILDGTPSSISKFIRKSEEDGNSNR